MSTRLESDDFLFAIEALVEELLPEYNAGLAEMAMDEASEPAPSIMGRDGQAPGWPKDLVMTGAAFVAATSMVRHRASGPAAMVDDIDEDVLAELRADGDLDEVFY